MKISKYTAKYILRGQVNSTYDYILYFYFILYVQMPYTVILYKKNYAYDFVLKYFKYCHQAKEKKQIRL